MQIQVPLKNLRFGHDAEMIVNARVAGRRDGIDTLAANIFARGLIAPLVVKKAADDSDIYYVSDGGRRLAALHMIHGETSEELIDCTLREVDDAGAFEDSLTTAVLAHQLHPVDQYEAFAKLEERGKGHEEIARQYGLTEKQVRQALALGRLSPKIREAWRKGDIRTEIAQAFTLSLDHKTQDRVFVSLQQQNHLTISAIRESLAGDSAEGGALVDFVGVENYQARGGTVTVDLFQQHHMVSDIALLNTMADERLQAECERLVADGWLWASKKDDLPASWGSWPVTKVKIEDLLTDDERKLAKELQRKIDLIDQDEDADFNDSFDLERQLNDLHDKVRPRGFTAKQKKKLGCMVGVDNDGVLIVQVGIARPVASTARAAAAAAPTAGAAPDIKKPAAAKAAAAAEVTLSSALVHRLSVQLTNAAATALAQDQELALIVLLAGFASDRTGNVRVHLSGLGAHKLDLTGNGELADNIAMLRKMKPADRLALIAPIAAAALDFQTRTLDTDLSDKYDEVAAVCNAIAPASLNAALRGAFDAKDYFGSVPKALCLAAIKDVLGADEARRLSNAPKSDVEAFALANVPDTGWLPPQLRAKGYDGPPARAKAAAKAPTKKKVAKKKTVKKAAKTKSKR